MLFCKLFLLLASLVCYVHSATFSNPLKDPNGSDPFLVTFEDYYYFLTTTNTNVQITRATTLEGLKMGENKVVYSDDEPSRCCNVWAPEIHNLDGTWYLYYTAGWSTDVSQQHVHVLRGGASPWDAYAYAGQLTTDWGIDATVLRSNGSENYLVWSCLTDAGQSLCAAPLNDPTSIGSPSVISNPTETWEDVGKNVNEGPAALYHGGNTYLTYSASYCETASYQLGLLTWNRGDPLLEGSWVKTGPVFSSANDNYGTGHNGFFTSFDGTQIWNIYHATSESGGTCGGDRHTMAQVVNWNSDGTPNFGAAPPLNESFPGPSGE